MNGKRLKVCFISTAKIWGGGEIWHYKTICEMRAEIEPLAVASPHSPFHQHVSAIDVPTATIRGGRFAWLNPFKLLKAIVLLRRLRPDAILFNGSADFKLFALAGRLAGVPKRVYRRDNGSVIKPRPLNLLILHCVTHYIYTSQLLFDRLSPAVLRALRHAKVEHICNAISLKAWEEQIPEPLRDRQPSEVVFGCLARLSLEKGLLDIPEAVASLSQSERPFRVLIAGVGPLEAELRERIVELGLQQRIELLGFVDNKAFLRSIDCLLLPSRWESQATVAIEAMAMRLPVVAYNASSNPEVVCHGQTGLLAEAFNVSDFAAQMRFMLNHPSDMQRMGYEGRLLMEAKFTKERTNAQLLAYLR